MENIIEKIKETNEDVGRFMELFVKLTPEFQEALVHTGKEMAHITAIMNRAGYTIEFEKA